MTEIGSPADLLSAIDQLDGKSHSIFAITGADGTILTVGGGPSEFVVTAERNGEHWVFLDRAAERAQNVSLIVGGQWVRYAARSVLSRKMLNDLIAAIIDGKDLENWFVRVS